jgi:hypothetical protein
MWEARPTVASGSFGKAFPGAVGAGLPPLPAGFLVLPQKRRRVSVRDPSPADKDFGSILIYNSYSPSISRMNSPRLLEGFTEKVPFPFTPLNLPMPR